MIAKTVSVAARATTQPRRIFGPLGVVVAAAGSGATLLGNMVTPLDSVAVGAATLMGKVCSVEVVLTPRIAIV
jgi:hypothetical protein